MAHRTDDTTSEGWLNPPFGCRHMPDPLIAASLDQQYRAALRDSVRLLASDPSLNGKVFCFISAPIGGRMIAFAR